MGDGKQGAEMRLHALNACRIRYRHQIALFGYALLSLIAACLVLFGAYSANQSKSNMPESTSRSPASSARRN